MTLKDRIKEALQGKCDAGLKENIECVRKLNDKLDAANAIEDILNFSDDHAKLSTEELRKVKSTLQTSFDVVATWQKSNPTKELDVCDEINEVTMELEGIVQAMFERFTDKQTEKLQKLQSWVDDLQAAIEDLDIPEIDEAESLIHQMDLYALGVTQDYVMPIGEMERLFAPGSYPIRKDAPTPYAVPKPMKQPRSRK